MASFNNVARGLLGPGVSDDEVNDFQRKLLTGYPENSGKGLAIRNLLRVLHEEVEPHRPQLGDSIEKVYREARIKLMELTHDGVTGFLNPEKVNQLNRPDKKG